MKTIIISDVTLTKEDLKRVRESVIGWRDESMNQWPDAIPFTLQATTLISILAQVIEEYPDDRKSATAE
jgi:hypothetical protein